MRCLSACTAMSYNIPSLFESLKSQATPSLYRNVVHLEIPHETGPGNVFFFPYGSIVCWGLPPENENYIFKMLKTFEQQPIEVVESDVFSYDLGESAKISKDEIILPNQNVMTLLSMSHGLAQSVKLSTFESTIQKTFDSTKQFPEDLAKRGKISLSRSEIRRKMGKLFIERNSVNLHFDVLDTPEFFWEYPELEPLYAMIANYLDVETRVEVLNQRLDVVRELFEMLGNELNHQHSSRLELTIIALIVIEVAISLLHDVFFWI